MTTPHHDPFSEQSGAAYPPPSGYPPPNYPPQYSPANYGAPFGVDAHGAAYSEKSKIAAGLLQIFLGSFGVGRFYLGHIGMGIAQLLVTTLTFGVLGWIWGVVDGILILTGRVHDAQGRPLRP
ncbi:TM2 domain-containing protein [Mycobacterium sp. 1274756.6]|uniref:TM2 domain-containing protein n=1 Tax=Mycobacterium sp. 1274756.6 TaxID=1834076 RepID=UPI000800ECAD|nr:TM2 domain-containing protein [Mycobacterium sp. 1274756.6]OBJ68280.1 hypothetical protein A5643_14155 [Mycobacterium sp. 1274756.6]